VTRAKEALVLRRLAGDVNKIDSLWGGPAIIIRDRPSVIERIHNIGGDAWGAQSGQSRKEA
jgi:hypothetical protein